MELLPIGIVLPTAPARFLGPLAAKFCQFCLVFSNSCFSRNRRFFLSSAASFACGSIFFFGGGGLSNPAAVTFRFFSSASTLTEYAGRVSIVWVLFTTWTV